ncbi:long-chain fatty acid-CoA ligase [Linderina pennispora]|nr:long-chain fatty acid-CoA ligase [Linderina pennispora]
MDIKLVSVPEAEYYACNGVGEIWVRGPAVALGYLCPENTCKPVCATTADGWYRTGDIARWHADGQFEVIDRIKNIQKLANGEYVAIEKLEAVYKTSIYAANVCVDVQPDQRQPLAVVNPDPKTVVQLGESLGFSPDSKIHDLCDDPRIQEHIFSSLLEAAAAHGFLKTETVFGCIIDPEGWTPENGLLTAAAKLHRARIQQRLAGQIDAAYLLHKPSV